MQLPIVIPRAVPLQRERKPQDNIPQTLPEREAVRSGIRTFLQARNVVPPLSMEELRSLTTDFVSQRQLDEKYTDYVGVILSSEVWRDQLATVPFEKRLLLLPKCMRVEAHCPAPFDEFGLLCKQCGQCSIQDLQEEAERLGYAVLVAEGSALVMAIIETGKIEAIIGVSCLSVLEKAHPYMEAAAIPGVAIPLLQDDCKDVTVDLDWIWEVIHLHSDDQTFRLNLDELRSEVQTWFENDSLRRLMGPAKTETAKLALDALAQAGKRWRPFLTVCAWKALLEGQDKPAPDDLKKLAIAVECFHKASLIHDDIEDDDDFRYGEATLHVTHGVGVAINVGDYLIGEGYRLIGECKSAGSQMASMLLAASMGHRTLCLGQGAELIWAQNPQPLAMTQVLDIFRQKTAPAFEVALQLGAHYAGADEETSEVIARYSEALGIAYQIRDDLHDMDSEDESDDLKAMRPSLPLAILGERTKAKPDEYRIVEKAWRREASDDDLAEIRRLMEQYEVRKRCQILQESYKEEAIRALTALDNPSLKGLLRRVISKIFTIEVQGWCSEFESRNVASRPTLAEVAR
ncbi:polyprenyl synthetase family protein [Lacunimicrobium album]